MWWAIPIAILAIVIYLVIPFICDVIAEKEESKKNDFDRTTVDDIINKK